jgi:PIN domain nuclease of toxin-antitoxin system
MVRLNLLLDTHVFIWQVMGDVRLSNDQRQIISDPANVIFLSAVSIFEMSIKVGLGKLDIPKRYNSNLLTIFDEHDFVALHVSPQHADVAGRLPGPHRDPFDRLLAAQSIVEGMSIMTGNKQIRNLGAQVVW